MLATKPLVLLSFVLVGAIVASEAGIIMAGQPQSAPSNHAIPNQVMTQISINATGQATAIPSTNASNVILNLTGTIQSNPGGQLKFSNITGSLRIGDTNYTLVSGQGVENNKGMVEIHAQTSNGLELILHGNIQGNSVVFMQPQSKLASLYFLSLQGKYSTKT